MRYLTVLKPIANETYSSVYAIIFYAVACL